MASTTSHPYVPTDAALPGFHPQLLSCAYILAVFFGTVAAVIGSVLAWAAGKKFLCGRDKFLICWFTVCGFIHLVVEGTVVANRNFFKDTSGNFLNEIWKEYAKADSRYATRDAFVIQMEGVTAFVWGPLSFLAAYAIATCKSWRFTLMSMISIGQFYGCVLYFTTCQHIGWYAHSRPEPLYFWFYFIIVNAIWLVIPGWIISYCTSVLNRAAAGCDKFCSPLGLSLKLI